MPSTAVQLQQEIDRALKRVDHGILEFSNCWRHIKADAASQDIHSQHEKLKKLSDGLQLHLPQLQSLSRKSGVRKTQREKLEAARVSIDQQSDNFKAFEHKLKERELVANGGPIQLSGNADDSKGGKIEASVAKHEVPSAEKDVKVQFDQVLREDEEEFICKICQVHVVGCEPKLARCSHIFCGDCIAKWFEAHPRSLSWAQRAQSDGRVPCPVCKEPLHEQKDLFNVGPTGQSESALLWRLLSGVKIACANNAKCRVDGNCTWIGEYGSYQKHIQKCTNVALDNEASPVAALAVAVGQSLQRHDSIHPCDISEDQHEHDVETTDLEKKVVPGINRQQVQPAPSHIEATAGAASCAGLTDSIMQLTGHSSAKTSDPGVQPQSKQVRRALHPFPADGATQLDIKAGELIEVSNEHASGWTYGRIVSESPGSVVEESAKGWFPNWVVASN
jgi:hypothetical protein